ncbi:MAG: GNAT family N-acetyltransferase [Eubacteriales bacterium]|nr:GNAT family N-acetyltransferase [Eubacteriales bacterium]
MEIKKLNDEQIVYVYQTYMMEHFPDDERKPLAMIRKALNEGTYECLGLFEDAEVLGYAFFSIYGKSCLFDYLGIADEYRNKGLGSELVKYVGAYYREMDCVFGEVEDYTLAETEEERSIQERRYHFYLRNGLVDTGVRVEMFGVDYIVLEVPVHHRHTWEQMKAIYADHYAAMLPKPIFDQKIRVKDR